MPEIQAITGDEADTRAKQTATPSEWLPFPTVYPCPAGGKEVHMMLLMLLLTVPVGLALAVAIDLADSRDERIDTWIDDAHPVFARPTPDVVPRADVARNRRVGPFPAARPARVRGVRRHTGGARHPRRVLPLH
jgi:hypothetical protein